MEIKIPKPSMFKKNIKTSQESLDSGQIVQEETISKDNYDQIWEGK